MKNRIKIAYIVFVLCIFLIGCSSPTERTYYIPQAKMYVKTIFRKGEKSGYILFSNDSVMSLSKVVDHVQSSANLSAVFILNTMNNSDIGIHNNGNIEELNSAKFHFIKNINETDTLYYKKRYLTNPLIVKSPYIEFVITDYFNRALIKESGAENYRQIYPIR